MTDMTLQDAIAEVTREGPPEGWTAATVADGHPYPSALAGHVAVILNAAASGDLIPATDARLAAQAEIARLRAELATARDDALQLATTVVRQALIDAAHNYKHDKNLSAAMFKAEIHATNAISSLTGGPV